MPPSIRVFSSDSALCIRGPNYWSFSCSNTLSNEYSGLISFRINLFGFPIGQGTLNNLLHHNSKASVLWLSAFFMVQMTGLPWLPWPLGVILLFFHSLILLLPALIWRLSLCALVPNQISDRVLGEVEKNIALLLCQVKGTQQGAALKTVCLNLKGLVRSFIPVVQRQSCW